MTRASSATGLVLSVSVWLAMVGGEVQQFRHTTLKPACAERQATKGPTESDLGEELKITVRSDSTFSAPITHSSAFSFFIQVTYHGADFNFHDMQRGNLFSLYTVDQKGAEMKLDARFM